MDDQDHDQNVARYRRARVACEVARNFLLVHDFDRLLAEIGHADAVGALVDPTLYREKHRAMLEDRAVFEAARAFLRTWPSEQPESHGERRGQ